MTRPVASTTIPLAIFEHTATIADQHAMPKIAMKPSNLVPTMKTEYLAIRCIATMTNVVVKVIEDPAIVHFC